MSKRIELIIKKENAACEQKNKYDLRQNKGLSLDASQQPANIHSTFARLDP
jgi:hypothetical protein